VYIRQSTPGQVQHNLESQRSQYALVDRARALGWQDIDIIDDDLGISGSGTHRPGFERLLRALCDGQVGAVFSIEASRLARNGRDWHTLLDFCSVVGALLIDAEALYDPRLTNDRLLLGMKGTISEMEVANFRERAHAALLQKAQRGALIRRVPIGYVKGSDDRIEKDPDARVGSTAKLLAQYPGPRVIRYQCSGYLLNRDRACCVMFGGLRADRLVSEQLMQSLAPFGVEAAIEATECLQGASDERIQQKALALENARYEVTRARRQYDAVDPANRLVAAELERRWNQALATDAQLEAELVTLQQNRERPLTDTQKRELLSFARDLPMLWDDPHSLPEYKKRLLRIALKEIIATCEGETIRLVLHWQGGDHTQVEFQKIGTGRHRYATDDDLVEIVRMLARAEPDARIASILNRNQRRTAHGQNWTVKRICSLRNNHAIPVYREGERQARGEMSVSEGAAALGVTPTTVLRLIRLKQLPASQACVSAPWILRRADVERCVAGRNHPATPPMVDSAQLMLEIP
jgi:DNA invertase Pin-like site-specific DNA recombinase